MQIAVFNASSQKDKNSILYETTAQIAQLYGHKAINFGVFPEEAGNFSYIQIALSAGALLASGAVDFVVTGCSSGMGMMLACNSLPGMLCGFISNPTDAYLFGRINNGNAISYPLGLNFGWSGELNLKFTLEKLFDGPLGGGYPPEDAQRKRQDTLLLKSIKTAAHIPYVQLLEQLDMDLIRPVFQREVFNTYLFANSSNTEITAFVRACTNA